MLIALLSWGLTVDAQAAPGILGSGNTPPDQPPELLGLLLVCRCAQWFLILGLVLWVKPSCRYRLVLQLGILRFIIYLCVCVHMCECMKGPEAGVMHTCVSPDVDAGD